MQPTFLEVIAGVRYWEDATVNGIDDEAGTLIPMRHGENWTPLIRLSDGLVMGWPQGTSADIHYKVCDQGEYWLLGEEQQRVAKWAGSYVPNDLLCHGDDGFGDYIILKVGLDGLIEKWHLPEISVNCDFDKHHQSGWVAVD